MMVATIDQITAQQRQRRAETAEGDSPDAQQRPGDQGKTRMLAWIA
jgi:hypothetical protein